jgi:hypothetical protein
MYKFEKPKKVKNVAVLFTAGLDSTFLVYKNLMEGHNVYPIYVEVANNVNKSLIEKQSIVRMYTQFKKEFGDKIRSPHRVTKVEIWQGWSTGLRFNQIPIWLFAMNFTGCDYDEIQVGYVANDDAISYLDKIKETYKAMNWFYNDTEKRAELTFPISQVTKYEILQTLPYKYKELVYSCENPFVLDEYRVMEQDIAGDSRFKDHFLETPKDGFYNYNMFEPCGDCDPCKKILNTEHLYSQYSGNQYIFKKLKSKQILNNYEMLLREARHNSEIQQMVALSNQQYISEYGDSVWKVVEPNKYEEKYKKVELLTKEAERSGNAIITAEQKDSDDIQSYLHNEVNNARLKNYPDQILTINKTLGVDVEKSHRINVEKL